MSNFFDWRDEAVEICNSAGIRVLEPDTVWGTGPANVPAIQGIAGCYGLGEQYSNPIELGEKPSRNYFASKYQDEFGERLFDLTADGADCDEAVGSVDELNWYGKVDLSWVDLLKLGWIFFADRFHPRNWVNADSLPVDTKNMKLGLPIGAILMEDSRGFCYYVLFFREEEMNAAWEQIEADYAAYYAEQEQEGEIQDQVRASEDATALAIDNGRSNY